MLEELASLFAKRFAQMYEIVEPAHMELAEPSIATAYDRCVKRGAQRIVVCPFFLGPGKHWTQDIPRLTAEAAHAHPAIAFFNHFRVLRHPGAQLSGGGAMPVSYREEADANSDSRPDLSAINWQMRWKVKWDSMYYIQAQQDGKKKYR